MSTSVGAESALAPAGSASAEVAARSATLLETVSLRAPQAGFTSDSGAAANALGARMGELRTFLPGEVVRHTNILVRDGGGEIRLVLRPESLGSVRINISIENGSLEGRIIVENASVREVIENNLSALRNALRQEGFDDPALDVSVGDRGAGGQRRDSSAASGRPDADGKNDANYRSDAVADFDHGYGLDSHDALAVNLVV